MTTTLALAAVVGSVAYLAGCAVVGALRGLVGALRYRRGYRL